MSIIKKFIFIVFVVVISSANVLSQTARSPFTSFGIGEPYGNSLIHNQGTGGLGVALPQVWYLNNQNPALLVYNTLTVFQAGLLAESRTIRGDTTNEKSTGGNLNYLVTAFPVVRGNKPGVARWTTSLGLMPYTTVNYGLQSDYLILDNYGVVVDTAVTIDSGSGGLNQFYWSNGVSITSDFNLGAKITYLFGPLESLYSIIDDKNPIPYEITITEKTSVKDFTLGLAGSYSKDSLGPKNNYRLTAGAVYNLKTNLKASNRTEKSRSTLQGIDIERDTLTSSNGRIRLPASISFGVSLSKAAKWSVGTEFNYQDWSSFKSINQDDEGLGKSWKIALGGELTTDAFAAEGYFKRVTYRAGLNYERYPFFANGNDVKDLGINFGFSLPAGRSSLDFAFKVGKRGDRAQNILEENYFKLYFGITFNDQWFIKRKFD